MYDGLGDVLLVYLWGIETLLQFSNLAAGILLLVYLWGIETWQSKEELTLILSSY